MRILAIILLQLMIAGPTFGQTNNRQKPLVGAYYFGGWTAGSKHITQKLTGSFADRKPVWGWNSDSKKAIDQQILAASDAGLDFFSFCWYFSTQKSGEADSLNAALRYFQESVNKSKLRYCLLVSNHYGFEISPDSWAVFQERILADIKQDNYLQVDGAPLLIFLSAGTLLKNFGSAESIKSALSSLREAAKGRGLPGLKIALCSSDDRYTLSLAGQCGFDFITGYNYHNINQAGRRTQPVNNLVAYETRTWERITQLSEIPYFPAVTLNWDPRPWTNSRAKADTTAYFTGFSANSVYESMKNCRTWLRKHANDGKVYPIIMIYAWNELGEGSYLVPTSDGHDRLKSLKRSLNVNVR
ncbi:MAG: glycoside hydrolase family 99-like domain-containing protein [Dyadobacter sp.]|uniref:glycoside hydrolase family 99-like domain-containing protein n=1 Tax=Dyadobacter sp. TaxID=1914288 RepID=UPI001B015D00|nr:glycoside hydrolase family 99-like domain-containing protein [Dyadobacter sp.]MBO9616377.1 glycoside hydrolase family 99-like domain-containing protein [Dyadobacter sp.]